MLVAKYVLLSALSGISDQNSWVHFMYTIKKSLNFMWNARSPGPNWFIFKFELVDNIHQQAHCWLHRITKASSNPDSFPAAVLTSCMELHPLWFFLLHHPYSLQSNIQHRHHSLKRISVDILRSCASCNKQVKVKVNK